jgi:hypothetical protein
MISHEFTIKNPFFFVVLSHPDCIHYPPIVDMLVDGRAKLRELRECPSGLICTASLRRFSISSSEASDLKADLRSTVVSEKRQGLSLPSQESLSRLQEPQK